MSNDKGQEYAPLVPGKIRPNSIPFQDHCHDNGNIFFKTFGIPIFCLEPWNSISTWKKSDKISRNCKIGRRPRRKSRKRARSESSSSSSSSSESRSRSRSNSPPARNTRAQTAARNSRLAKQTSRTTIDTASANAIAQNLEGLCLKVDELLQPPVPQEHPSNVQQETIDRSLSLDSVGGLPDQVKWLRDNIILPFTHKKALKDAWGYEPEKGVIFHGPPGCGKSLLAAAFASEINKNGRVSFFMRKGTDCLDQYVGNSEKNIRDLFTQAKECQPSVIFFDELDGLCPSRNQKTDQVYSSIVTTLLGEIDGVKRGSVLLIGATNRLEAIDPALRRPGRFGKELSFYPPNEAGRLHILNIHVGKWKKKPAEEILGSMSKQTTGYTGADLEQLSRHAFNCARERSTPEGGNFTSKIILNMDVLAQDWEQALRNTSRTNTNVFGNTMFVGKDLLSELKPLLGDIKSEMQSVFEDLYPAPGTVSKPLVGFNLKIAVFWSETESGVSVLNDLIIPSILSAIDPVKVPTFHLSATTPFDELFSQIDSNFKETVILYIDKIDEFWGGLPYHEREEFQKLFSSTRGRRVILLTTSTSSSPFQLPFESISPTFVFQQLRKTKDEERREFYRPVFDPKGQYFSGTTVDKVRSNKLNGFFNKIVKLTEGKEVTEIMQLQGNLADLCNKSSEKSGANSKDDDELLGKFEEMLKQVEGKMAS